MRVLVHGITGHMGQIIASLAESGFAGATLAGGVSPDVQIEENNNFKSFATCNVVSDVVVDFSFHGAVKELLDYCISKKLPVVVATTGHTAEEKKLIEDAAKKIPVFFSANMSVGVAVLADLAKSAAAAFPTADIEIVETHHNRKIDVPSGTALLLANSIKEARPESVYNIGRPDNGKRTKEEIGIHSLRMGNIVGIHEILISTGTETITLKHEAHSRALFGEGALRAAAFLIGKKPGLYNMKDMIR
ncbi:MAG: 4-hydroxy-tetrahydrodipicolinate reductase [Spirochaetales bacterium]|nr:4-hydroxy-tetrahydrodipicolinate reductase [Spirochaetales bacterium]